MLSDNLKERFNKNLEDFAVNTLKICLDKMMESSEPNYLLLSKALDNFLRTNVQLSSENSTVILR